MMKVCKTCRVEKDVDEFYNPFWKQKHLKSSYCKPCDNSRHLERKKTAEYKECQNNYRKKRYATDPAYRVQVLSRGRLNKALNGRGSKPAKTMELVGCTAEELIAYLQELIPEGADLKKFHIDHIRPCASFDFSDPEEIRKCFHYSNLQPLTPQANMRKGAKHFLTQ